MWDKEKNDSVHAARRMGRVVQKMKAQYPELFYPLSRMGCVEKDGHNRSFFGEETLSTDGLQIYYDPASVMKMDDEMVAKKISHLLFHGILGHIEHWDESDYWGAINRKLMDRQAERMSDWFGIPKDSDVLWTADLEEYESGCEWPSDDLYGTGLIEEKGGIHGMLAELGRESSHDVHMWVISEESAECRERVQFWKRARETFIAAIEGRVMDRMFRQHLRRTRLGWSAQELEALWRGEETDQAHARPVELDDGGWWELTEYFCELLADEAEGGTDAPESVCGKLERLFTTVEQAGEKEILQEKAFLFVSGNKALLRAVRAVRPEGYLRQCGKWLAGREGHQFV